MKTIDGRMKIGSLVTLSNPWRMGGFRVGIVLSKGFVFDQETWTVLWTTKHSYEILEHIDGSLVELE